MTIDAFADRLARVRQRFVSTLQGKIENAAASIPQLADVASSGAAAAVGETYRCVHGIVGVGPTVGFPATGRAAREVENLLKDPYRNGRGLTGEEIDDLTKRLRALHDAAAGELHSFLAVEVGARQ